MSRHPSTARKYSILSRAGRERVLALVRDGMNPRAAINAVLCDELMMRAS